MVGHKVGLSSEAMQKMMNVDEPDYDHRGLAFVPDSTIPLVAGAAVLVS